MGVPKKKKSSKKKHKEEEMPPEPGKEHVLPEPVFVSLQTTDAVGHAINIGCCTPSIPLTRTQ
jgi:hypothetical protein